MKVTINIELEGHPKKVNQDFSDWYRGMRRDIDRPTIGADPATFVGTIPPGGKDGQFLICDREGRWAWRDMPADGDQPSKHEPEKASEATPDKDQDVASTGDWKDEFVAELRKAWGTGSASNASNQYVPPKYLRDEPLTSDDVPVSPELGHVRHMKEQAKAAIAAEQKLDAVKVDPFRPLVHGPNSADSWKYPPAFINEFNHLLDRRRLEFRETLLRVFSDATKEECAGIMEKTNYTMAASELVNEVLRRRRGEA